MNGFADSLLWGGIFVVAGSAIDAIKGLITNANPFIRYGIYSNLNSAAMSAFPYIFM